MLVNRLFTYLITDLTQAPPGMTAQHYSYSASSPQLATAAESSPSGQQVGDESVFFHLLQAGLPMYV